MQVVDAPQHSVTAPQVLPRPVQQTVTCCPGVTAQSPEQHAPFVLQAAPRAVQMVVVVVADWVTVMMELADVLLGGRPLSVALKVTVLLPGAVGVQLKVAVAGLPSAGVNVEPVGRLVAVSVTRVPSGSTPLMSSWTR